MDFYEQMLAQFGLGMPAAPQTQMQGYNPMSFMTDAGVAPSMADTMFGMPQLGGAGMDFGGYRQMYNVDETGGYDYGSGQQQPTYQGGQQSTAGLFGLGDGNFGGDSGESYSPYTY
jgi:hypothetical protein